VYMVGGGSPYTLPYRFRASCLKAKLMKSRPYTWEDCVKIARLKFEKYFNHKVFV